jgi:hypothetical protein
MDIVVFRPHELPIALGALRRTELAPSPQQDRYLDLVARLHGATLPIAELPTPNPRETALRIPSPHARKRLLQLGIVMSMVDGAITAESIPRLVELDRALDVREPAIATLRKVRARQDRRVQMDVMRRTAGKIITDAYRETGLVGAYRIVLAFLQMFEDPEMIGRFTRLQRAPEGSLGRSLWAHCTQHGLRLPGERGGIPERAIHHDVGHILAGYGTDSMGEILQSAFQAGYMRKDGFGFMLLGIIHWHMGIQITPVSEGVTGYFDIDRVMTALARGAACKVDLSDPEQFDFWAFADKPVAQVRAELGITPLPEAQKAAA